MLNKFSLNCFLVRSSVSIRRVLLSFFVFLSFFILNFSTAFADTPYQGTINSTYVNALGSSLSSISPFEHYVLWRSGENEYMLVVSDTLEYSNGQFTCDECTIRRMEYQSASGYGYSSYYTYSSSSMSNYLLKPSGYLVYSDLGGYPDLRGGDVYALWFIAVAFSVFAVCALIRPIFSFVLRFSNGGRL